MTTCERVDLAAEWDYSLSRLGPWAPMKVPSSWFLEGLDSTGPVWFRRTITIDASWAGRRNWLRFGGVDYEAIVFLDLAPGDYVLETLIRDRGGAQLGENSWNFSCRAPDSAQVSRSGGGRSNWVECGIV